MKDWCGDRPRVKNIRTDNIRKQKDDVIPGFIQLIPVFGLDCL